MERERYKVCALAVQYGMGAKALAAKLGLPEVFGKVLLEKHRETYSDYWRWSDEICDMAMLGYPLQTAFGWRVYPEGPFVNPRSMRNFPVQASGAEILRIACIAISERNINICA